MGIPVKGACYIAAALKNRLQSRGREAKPRDPDDPTGFRAGFRRSLPNDKSLSCKVFDSLSREFRRSSAISDAFCSQPRSKMRVTHCESNGDLLVQRIALLLATRHSQEMIGDFGAMYSGSVVALSRIVGSRRAASWVDTVFVGSFADRVSPRSRPARHPRSHLQCESCVVSPFDQSRS